MFKDVSKYAIFKVEFRFKFKCVYESWVSLSNMPSHPYKEVIWLSHHWYQYMLTFYNVLKVANTVGFITEKIIVYEKMSSFNEWLGITLC